MKGSRNSTGIDVVSIERMRRAAANQRFLERVFTDGELSYAMGRRDPHRHLAGRFAAKEAYIKACSMPRAGFKAIEVTREWAGRPGLRVEGESRRLHLSISYSGGLAFAFVYAGQG